MSSDLLKALREGTADSHRALESEIDFLNSSLTIGTYVQTLRIFAAFVSSWERLAAEHCPARLADSFHNRRRTLLLEADLDFFEASRIDTTFAPPSSLFPSIDTPSAFFGAWYVMEGSTLGGQVIARHLESSLQLSDGKGYSYFRGHGSDTGRMWKEFLALLAHEEPLLNETKAVASASAMFEAFRAFYTQQKQDAA